MVEQKTPLGWRQQRRPYVRRVDYDRLTKPQLTAIYNALSPVKVEEFRHWSTAVRRVDMVLARNGQAVVDHDTGSPDATRVGPLLWVASEESVPGDAPPRSETRWRDSMRITLLRTDNPKREGTASWMRWQLVRDGMTVGEYLAACEAAGLGKRWRGDIIWALEHDWIALDEDGEPVTLPPQYADLAP